MNNKNRTLAPALRFPEFKDCGEWEEKKLGEITVKNIDKTKGKRCKLMSITAGQGLISQIEKFGREIAGNSYNNYIVIKKDDFVYNKSSTKIYPEGEIARYNDNEEGAVPNSIFISFRFDTAKVYPLFAGFLFEKNIHGYWLRKFISMGARAHGALQVNDEDFFAMPLSFPSISEQQRIASCLSSLDELIAANSKKLELLKAHKKGLLQNLFPQNGEKIPKYRFPEFKDCGEWEEKKLGVVADINPSNKDLPQEFIYIDIGSVVSGVLMQKNQINLENAPSRAQRLLKKGDIIFQMVRPYQKNNYHFFPEDNFSYVASTGYAQLRVIQSSEYLYQYLHTDIFVKKVLEKCTGSNYPAINSSELSNISIKIPKNIKEQQRIASCLSSLDDLISAQSKRIEQLQLHKKGLMQGLFPKNEGAVNV